MTEKLDRELPEWGWCLLGASVFLLGAATMFMLLWDAPEGCL
jgi:hypothetical protein